MFFLMLPSMSVIILYISSAPYFLIHDPPKLFILYKTKTIYVVYNFFIWCKNYWRLPNKILRPPGCTLLLYTTTSTYQFYQHLLLITIMYFIGTPSTIPTPYNHISNLSSHILPDNWPCRLKCKWPHDLLINNLLTL